MTSMTSTEMGLTMSEVTQIQRAVDVLAKNLQDSLQALKEAKAYAKSPYQTDVFQAAEALMASQEGLEVLYQAAGTFEECGVFNGGPWEDPAKLQPALVAGSLKASGVYPVVETLSELRLLALAKGHCQNQAMNCVQATQFLNEVMALNLEFVFPGDTEQERLEGGPHREANIRLFHLIAEELGLASLRVEVIREIQQVCAQRPISTKRVRDMIMMASRVPHVSSDPETDELTCYREAVSGPTRLCREHQELSAYRLAIGQAPNEVLEAEAESFCRSMKVTGLVSRHHAVLVRLLARQHPDLLARALGLGEHGASVLAENRDFVQDLIKVAIFPGTAQALYGLSCLLERGSVSRQEIRAGLQRLISLDLRSDVKRMLLARRRKRDGVTPNSILVAGLLMVLGQPLGVGQGRNPTCQAARCISLWAQHAEGNLIHFLISAARDGTVEIDFEGQRLKSSEVTSTFVRKVDHSLDPVSLVLVPHLDLLYEEMMRRVAGRNEDSHKWVNPGLYGRWVPSGFASVFSDLAQTTVTGYEDFVRLFYATHHPAYNDGQPLMYPIPVGLCVTSSQGDYLGPHAISIQRVAEDPQGNLRVYFFNPNNEGRQNWGRAICPSVDGRGERTGESSLPFAQFTSRLYAFHYNPYEEGDPFAVPEEDIDFIEESARHSWGKAFHWTDPPRNSEGEDGSILT